MVKQIFEFNEKAIPVRSLARPMINFCKWLIKLINVIKLPRENIC